MFVDPRTAAKLNRAIFNAIVAPRPIGWISSQSAEGHVNLAPFSHFNIVSTAPPVILFSCNTPGDRAEKDTLANVRATGEFVFNLATFDLREAVNTTSTPAAPDVDEFEARRAGKGAVRQREAAAGCGLAGQSGMPAAAHRRNRAGAAGRHAAATWCSDGSIGLHIRDEYLTAAGRFDTIKAQPLTRLGGIQYAPPGTIFEMPAPFRRVGE